jgi:2',3'-cyclic-nucleotide 2'-phosphodiesterase / 3'-nucleotidase / 5'-nucleotidase
MFKESVMRFVFLRRVVMLVASAALVVSAASAHEDFKVTLTPLSTYTTGVFDEGAAEIVAYDPSTQALFVVNGNDDTIDVLDASDPAALSLTSQIKVVGGPNHVDVLNGVVIVAAEGEETESNGTVQFFNAADGAAIASVEVGVLPDDLAISPDGRFVVTANEGEPSDDYTVDPEGSISIIDISGGIASLTQANVTTLGFTDFNEGGSRAAELSADVRIYGPNASVAQDLEPEYVAISPDSSTAYVTLQENNALALVNLTDMSLTAILPLGFKDHSLEGNALDASNEDGAINIQNWPVFGMYQPDAVKAYDVDGTIYLLTANEGDTRDYDGYSEEAEVQELTLDAEAFPNAADLQPEAALGKLEVTNAIGDTDGDGDFDALYVPGARSFSIWNAATGALVWDSGDALERITAEMYPDDFNATNDENGSFDDRSDNKGPEPEGLALGEVEGHVLAFIGLERIGGVMVYDITDPTAPEYVTYINTRDFSGDAEAGTASDLGPEGLYFIPAESSPNGQPLLAVANEISGSTTLFQIAPAS